MFKERNNLRLSDMGLIKTGTVCGKSTSTSAWGARFGCIGTYKSIDSVYDGFFIPGKLRLNPVTIRSGTGTVSNGSFLQCGTNSSSEYTGPLAIAQVGPRKQFGSFDSGLKGVSDNRCLGKLNKADAEAAVFLAELSQVLRMLKNPFRGLQDFLRSRNAGSLMTLSSNQWLQYRYGILPFISDILAAIALYNKACMGIDSRMRRCAAGAVNVSTSTEVLTHTLFNTVFTVTRTVVTECASHSHAYYNILTQDLVARDLGFNLGNTPLIAWELVPYSFVVDWFLSVGTWLQALNPNPNYKHLGGCTSQKITISETMETSSPRTNNPNISLVRWTPSIYTWTSNTLIRQVGFPVASAPQLNGSILTFKRMLDSVALLWSRLK